MSIRRGARGSLSEGDRALWQAYTARAAVVPMPGKALVDHRPSPRRPDAPDAAAAAPAPALAVPPPPRPAPPRLHPELHVGTAPGGLDAKRWRDLRRGRTQAERTLDLHGRRAQDAHAAVRRFLAEAQADGLRCVAIVTGKGSSAEGGVLRRELPHWLNAPELRPLLLGAAHPHAANTGAVYLLLRRARSTRDAVPALARQPAAGPAAGGAAAAVEVPESFAALLGRTVRRLRRR